MTATTANDEDRLARLLAALPPAPQGWVEAAQELPLVRRDLDDLVARAEADLEFREAILADLEATLALEGYAPSERLVEELRRRLAERDR